MFVISLWHDKVTENIAITYDQETAREFIESFSQIANKWTIFCTEKLESSGCDDILEVITVNNVDEFVNNLPENLNRFADEHRDILNKKCFFVYGFSMPLAAFSLSANKLPVIVTF